MRGTLYQLQVRGTWAGYADAGWRPAVDGTLNQSGMDPEEASTFRSRRAALTFALEFVVPENPAEWRIVEVQS